MDNEDCDFEHSRFSGEFTRDDITVDIEIYRTAGTQDPWQLAVVSLSSGCTRWQQSFETEKAAFEAFLAVVDAAGIASLAGATPKIRH
jgi:hypothetical protein